MKKLIDSWGVLKMNVNFTPEQGKACLEIENAELRKENQRLNNVLNELKEWFKEFHKYQSRLKWNEEDYIEFIEHLENELKESDK